MFEGTYRTADYIKDLEGTSYCGSCKARVQTELMATKGQCRECRNARQRAWYYANHERASAAGKAYKAANRAKINARRRAQREERRRAMV